MASVKVNVLGDAGSLKRAYAEASAATKAFGRTAEETSGHVGGLTSGLGGAHESLVTFAKSAVLAGGALIGVGSLYEGIKSTADAAEAFNQAQRQLNAQLRANGESLKAVQPWVDKLAASQTQLGFNSTQTEKAFTTLDRASGSAASAYKYMAVTADLAAARHIDLNKAALLVGKVIDGNTAALNRYGVVIPKGTSAVDALRIAQQKLEGQARASVTPFEKFHAVLDNLKVQIGEVLLPVISKYIDKVTTWLSQADNQRKIVDTVKTAIHDMGVVLGVVRTVFEKMEPILKTVAEDGFAGIKVAIHLAKDAFDLLASTFGKHKAAMITGIAAIGVAITLAIGPEAAAIVGALLAVGYIKKHWGVLSDFFRTLSKEIQNSLNFAWVEIERGAIEAALVVVKPFSHLPKFLGGWARKAKDSMQGELDKLVPPNMDWGNAALAAGVTSGAKWLQGFQQATKTAAATGYNPATSTYVGGQSGNSTLVNPGSAGFVNPVPGGSYARVDQGTDYVARSNVLAAAAGVITSIAKGMAGGTGDIIKETLAKAIKVNGRSYTGIYYSEQKPLVHVGQGVQAGTPVMGPGGNELGFLDARGRMTPLVGGLGAGTKSTQMGTDFRNFVASLGGPGGSSTGAGAVRGLPPALAQAILAGSAHSGIPADVLVGLWRRESHSTFPNPAVNSSGYGGLFGTSNWKGSAASQVNTATGILSGLIRKHGNLSDALFAYTGGSYRSVPGQTTPGTFTFSTGPPGSPLLPGDVLAAQKRREKAAAKAAKASYELPASFTIPSLKAQLTKSTADDLKIVDAEIGVVQKAIASKKLKGNMLVTAWQKLVDLTDQQKSLMGDKSKKGFALPPRYGVAEAKAKLTTKSTADDLKVIDDEIAYTKKAIASKKLKGQDLADALNELVTLKDERKQLAPAPPTLSMPIRYAVVAAKAQFTTDVTDDLKNVDAEISVVKKAIASKKLKGQALADALNELFGLTGQRKDLRAQLFAKSRAINAKLAAQSTGMTHAENAAGRTFQLQHEGINLLSSPLTASITRQGGLGGSNISTLEKARTQLEALKKSALGVMFPTQIARELGRVSVAIDKVHRGLGLLTHGLAAAITKQGGIGSANLTTLEKAKQELIALQSTLVGREVPTAITRELINVNKAIDRIDFRKAENAWNRHMSRLKAISRKYKGEFETVFGSLASAALNEFDRQTQQGLAGIAASGAELTPSEKALRNVQDAHDQAAAQAQLAADQAAGNQSAVQEDLYQMQVAALQKQADAERTQRDKDTTQQEQDYQDQRDGQRTAFENQLADLKTQLETKHLTIADANHQILDLMARFGLDPTWFTAGSDAGNALISGLATAMAGAQVSLERANTIHDAITTLQGDRPGGGPTYSDANSTGGYGNAGGGMSPGNAPGPADAVSAVSPRGGATYSDANSTGGYGVPHLAAGGLITRTGIAMVHKGETVVPAGKGGGDTFHFSFPNYVGSKKELTDTVIAELRRANRSGSIRDFNFTR